ncbi:uncharacterized protein [Diadema antillarum]|uniref:uncharacterized protein n=1 Tax=Diadema antillarum TaxID=105358 RepID=UPI003A85B9ED
MHLFNSTSAATCSRYVAATARSTRATLGPLSAGAAAAAILRCTIIILSLFSVAATSGNNGKCCAQQQPPISDCSFSYYDEDTQNVQLRNVSCELKNGRRRGYVHGSCPDYGYTSKDHIPGPVKELRVEPFVTSCRHTMSNATPLMASSCNTQCRDYSGNFFSGINITFKADEISAEHLEGIEISLRKMSGESGVTVWCARMHIGETGLRWDAASQHTFYYDRFIGLEPTAVYEVSVKTLPTSVYSNNAVSTQVTIPKETCRWNHYCFVESVVV